MDSEKKKYILASWIISGVLAIASWCFCYFPKGNFSQAGLVDSFISASIILGLVFLLVILGHYGAFDLLSYGTRNVFFHMSNVNGTRTKKYVDYNDYVQKRREKNETHHVYWLSWVVFVAVLLLTGVVLNLVFSAIH